MANTHLHVARRHKSDEWFTRYEDIASELPNYDLSGKRIYMPCDDHEHSEFVQYFGDMKTNETFDVAEVVATSYNRFGSGKWYHTDAEITQCGDLVHNGDFKSLECQDYMANCDVVITNPPYSQMRIFMQQLNDFGVDYILVSPIFNLMYKGMWDDLISGRIWCGNMITKFDRPDGSTHPMLGLWMSTIKPKYDLRSLEPSAPYDPNVHIKYDNYDAIECSRINDIPMDYDGYIGVPVTIYMYDRSNFDIIGHARGLPKIFGTVASDLKLNGRFVFNRIIIRMK